MKYYLVTGRIPETETEAAHDNKIEIGESNPFDTRGKPFRVTYHESLGIQTMDSWIRLIHIYGDRIVHEFIKTPEGLRQIPGGDIVPAHHLIALLNDGFAKSGEGNKIIYSKQKGRIEDETGKTYTPDEIISMMDIK
jgi:hypothetical protein